MKKHSFVKQQVSENLDGITEEEFIKRNWKKLLSTIPNAEYARFKINYDDSDIFVCADYVKPGSVEIF